MAQLPTSDELARKILDIYQRNNSRAGHALMLGLFTVQAKFVDLAYEDVGPALQAALELGYIEEGPNNSVRLTEAGFAAM